MGIAVVGLGSMGKRRVRCLQANGVKDIVAVDPREDRREEAKQLYGIRTVESLSEALPEVEGVIVSVPGFLHMRFCLEATRAGKHWFCEVPLSINLDGMAELRELTTKGNLVGAPGCQLLWHPLARSLHEWAHGGEANNLLHVSYSFGSYLPEWHRYEDYRTFYASDKSKGGGNLDVIAQEMTWLRWVVDRSMRAVTARVGKTGNLELAGDTPDHQELVVDFEGGLTMGMHFDINDRTHERWVRFAGEHGTAKWSTLQSFVEAYDIAAKAWRKLSQPDGYDYEQCYLEEIGCFLRCIRKKDQWPISVEAAEQVVRLLLGIDKSSRDGRTVLLSQV